MTAGRSRSRDVGTVAQCYAKVTTDCAASQFFAHDAVRNECFCMPATCSAPNFTTISKGYYPVDHKRDPAGLTVYEVKACTGSNARMVGCMVSNNRLFYNKQTHLSPAAYRSGGGTRRGSAVCRRAGWRAELQSGPAPHILIRALAMHRAFSDGGRCFGFPPPQCCCRICPACL